MDLKTVYYENDFEEMINKLKATQLQSTSAVKHGLTALATSSPCSSRSIKIAKEKQKDIRDLITSEDLDLNKTIRHNQLSLMLAALEDSDDE